MTNTTSVRATGHRRRTERRTARTGPADADDAASPGTVLDALDDPDCRAMLSELDDPTSASDLRDACDIPSSTAYRKLDLLSDAGLVEERTALREDYQQVTLFVRTFESVRVAAGEDGLTVEIEERDRAPEDSLSTLWSQVKQGV